MARILRAHPGVLEVGSGDGQRLRRGEADGGDVVGSRRCPAACVKLRGSVPLPLHLSPPSRRTPHAQVHLSHNKLTLAGATALLQALSAQDAPAAASEADQAAGEEETGKGGEAAGSEAAGSTAVGDKAAGSEAGTTTSDLFPCPREKPCWMRLEWNRISLPSLMQVLLVGAAGVVRSRCPPLTLLPSAVLLRDLLCLFRDPSCSLHLPLTLRSAGAGGAACSAWPGSRPASCRPRRRRPLPARPAPLLGGDGGGGPRRARRRARLPGVTQRTAMPGGALPRAAALDQVCRGCRLQFNKHPNSTALPRCARVPLLLLPLGCWHCQRCSSPLPFFLPSPSSSSSQSCQYQLPSEAEVLQAARRGWHYAPLPPPPKAPGTAETSSGGSAGSPTEAAAAAAAAAPAAAAPRPRSAGPLLLFPDTSALLPMLGAGAGVSVPTFFTLDLLGRLVAQGRFGRTLPPGEQVRR